MSVREIGFGVVGGGLMGREFASAAARWCHLTGMAVRPRLVAVCDPAAPARQWFKDQAPGALLLTEDVEELLADERVQAVYCAVPHNLHAQLYTKIIKAGKHLLGEKPFGIDREANRKIMDVIAEHPKQLVRCCSEMPYFPGALRIAKWAREGRFGRIIEVEAGFWHCSDLNPDKPINWKRRSQTNGAYGCMGDLGLHAMHLPLRLGWRPNRVRALLSNIMPQRPDGRGGTAACDTWDNAILACDVPDPGSGSDPGDAPDPGHGFPMVVSTKRIAPGHANTWFLRVIGTRFSAEFSTKNPKQLWTMSYDPGGEQAWQVRDLGYDSAYPAITGGIFEFGFCDAVLQMWAAFCDELAHGQKGMSQSMYCATPQEATASHELFTAALQSQRTGDAVAVPRAARDAGA